jgi:hypothetical protein
MINKIGKKILIDYLLYQNTEPNFQIPAFYLDSVKKLSTKYVVAGSGAFIFRLYKEAKCFSQILILIV